jgi:hypothetical protein
MPLPIFIRDWLDSLPDAEFDQFLASLVNLSESIRTASAPPDAPPFMEQWLRTRTAAEHAIVAQTFTRLLQECHEEEDEGDEDELDDEGDDE